MIGRTFGKLLVVAIDGLYCICRCECGRDHRALSNNMRRGLTRTCGKAGCKTAKHHLGHTVEYKSWWAMMRRCTDPRDVSWPRYGARGIRVCDRWASFENFYADMGIRPSGMSLERINNDGNYEPTNCRWATRREQTLNRSSSRFMSIRGETKTLVEWADDARCRVNRACLKNRRGWNDEAAITVPVGFRRLSLR